MLNNKSVLITGGTGSFGQKCVRTILDKYKPRRLIVFSRDELKQYDMSQIFSDTDYPCMRYFIGDVRDKDRLRQAFRDVDYVIHAAALKQVPAAEYNPFEAIKTNVLGAQNIIDVAISSGVKRVIALSTDKACNPINLYGASKLCSDKLFIAGNSYTTSDGCQFSVVRYGNVVGSRGSVIPFFIKQAKKGILPITDPRMTRFWMTLQQGIEFVLFCLERMVGGELFIPKIPSMNIMDLATAICPDCETEVVGIRPGEKLHETMIPMDEASHTVETYSYYVIKPQFRFFQRRFNHDRYSPVSEGFEYRSDNNPQQVTIEQLRDAIKGL